MHATGMAPVQRLELRDPAFRSSRDEPPVVIHRARIIGALPGIGPGLRIVLAREVDHGGQHSHSDEPGRRMV